MNRTRSAVHIVGRHVRDNWRFWVVLAAVLLFAYFVWPTPYSYYHMAGGRLVRINRITQTVSSYYKDSRGWVSP